MHKSGESDRWVWIVVNDVGYSVEEETRSWRSQGKWGSRRSSSKIPINVDKEGKWERRGSRSNLLYSALKYFALPYPCAILPTLFGWRLVGWFGYCFTTKYTKAY
jgi:hypothetical protein